MTNHPHQGALDGAREALESVRAWERDEIDSDTDLILELEGALISALDALEDLMGQRD
jgi:hypothetical protein